MDFTIYLFPISIGMFEQAKPNTVEEYLLFKKMFTKYVPAEEVACIVVETIQGDGGL